MDVSKVSGWLNADVCCPSRKEGMRCGARFGPGGGRAWGRRWRKWHARGRLDCEGWAQGTRAERTSNMFFMVVTLDVSKLNGWLNAYACCRVERGAYDAE